ncbi:MAG: N-6 DNA methylase [Acidimicrobiales bacterium]
MRRGGAAARAEAATGLPGWLIQWSNWAAAASHQGGHPGCGLAAVAALAAVAGPQHAAPEALWARPEHHTSSPVPDIPIGMVEATLSAAAMEDVAFHYLLGRVYEATKIAPIRRKGGVFYTPQPVAAGLASLALDGLVNSEGGEDAGRVSERPAGPPAGNDRALVVLDPSVGAGGFLLAVGERLRVERGVTAAAIVEGFRGTDLDADAVAVARLALAWWSWACDAVVTWPPEWALRAGDGLAAAHHGGPPPGEADLVIGNPPFLNQLQGATARLTADRQRAQARFGDAAKGYVDTATLFALAGLDAVRPGGRVVLIQPESMLVASHGAAARAELARRATLEGLWIGGLGVFNAGVRVCAPILRHAEPATAPSLAAVKLWQGVSFSPSGRFDVDSPERRKALFDGSWASVLACSRGVPDIRLSSSGTLADVATATAGFRDQFYGLAPFVRDAPPTGVTALLITCGLIGPGICRWGTTPTRFAGQRWQRPTVDVTALGRDDPKLARWVGARLRPKVLLATQTPVLNVVADPGGVMVPSVPVISVEPRPPPFADTGAIDTGFIDTGAQPTLFALFDNGVIEDGGADAGAVSERGRPESDPEQEREIELELVWRIAAILWCPAISVIAAQRHAGAGLSANALRLSARQVLDLPLPAQVGPWHAAAAAYRQAVAALTDVPGVISVVGASDLGQSEQWRHAATLMGRAYGLDQDGIEAAQRWWDAQARPARTARPRRPSVAEPRQVD